MIAAVGALPSLFDATRMQNYDRMLAADRALIAGMFAKEEANTQPGK